MKKNGGNLHRLLLSSALWLTILAFNLKLSSGSKFRHFKWDVSYIFWSPDCSGSEQTVMAINGQFPGPTIRARAGDTINVELTNKLFTEGVVIHWHGIRQIGTPWADGTASISQCAINPGETFIYRFKVDKPGTYFYHGHYGMQRSAGLYGSLIVDVQNGKREPFHYHGEFNLLLSDWWHQSVHEQEVGLSWKPFRWIGEPQSILINGRGQFNCSLAAQYSNFSVPQCEFSGREQCAPQILTVHPRRTYRIRLASTTALASLNFAVKDHKMVVVEADGNYVQPFTVSDIDIYSGESYSVLLIADQNPNNNYWVSLDVRGRQPKTSQALTVLNYVNASPSELPSSPPPVAPLWNNYTHSKAFSNKIFALIGSEKPPLMADRRVSLLNTQNTIKGYTKWAINNISLVLPSTPYLGLIKFGLINDSVDFTQPPDSFPADYDVMVKPVNPNATHGSGFYKFTHNAAIDVILQNANALSANVSEIHPWHLHGHDFWVLGYGEGRFEEDDAKGFNLKNPPLRNTAVIFPFGWTALRFVADNPGVWAFHCHIEPHLHMGMGVIFSTAVHKVGKVPHKALACGLTARTIWTKP